MLNQLQKDLLYKHIGPFLFCFFAVMFILLMLFLIQHVDKLVGKGLELSIIIELILNNLAYMVVLAAPMAILVSTLMAFGTFSEWNELTAVKAAGVNPFSLIKPVLATGGVLFLLLTYFSNEILPEANHKARSIFIDIRLKKPGFDLQPGVFYDGIEGYTFLVEGIPAGSDSLYDITLFQHEGDNQKRAYIKADLGWLKSDDEQTLTLWLEDGNIIRYLPAASRGDEIETTHFHRYRLSFDLSDMAFSRSNPDQRSRNDRTMRAQAMLAYIDSLHHEKENELSKFNEGSGNWKNFRPDNVIRSYLQGSDEGIDTDIPIYRSGFEFLNQVEDPNLQSVYINQAISHFSGYRTEVNNLRTNVQWRNLRMAEFLVEVHKKISIPFACMIFILLGAPIGMMTRNGNIGFAAIVSIVLLVFYFVAVIQGEKWADRMVIHPFIGMWGINFLLLFVGILLTVHVTTSLSLPRLDKQT